MSDESRPDVEEAAQDTKDRSPEGDAPAAGSAQAADASAETAADGECRADPLDGSPRQVMQRRVFIILLVIMTGLFLYVLKPFFGPILWACVLAILFSPVNAKLLKWTRNSRNISSILTLLLALVLCVGPLLLVLQALYSQAMDLYGMLKSGQIDLDGLVRMAQDRMPAVREFFDRFGVSPDALTGHVTAFLTNAGKSLANKSVQFVGGTAQFLVGVALMLYLAFFMLRDGGRLTRLLARAIPVEDCRERLLLARFTGMIRAMVKGTLVIACIQGTLGGLTFWALGIKGPVLWGVVMGISAMIPMLGTWIVWLPFAIYLFLASFWYKALILALVGIFVIGLIDNFLRPRMVGRETRMPDWVILLSTLGGIIAFGINGFIVGPVIAALFLAFWQMFSKEYST